MNNPKVVMIVRYLLGLMLIAFGANKFFNFMPAPEFSQAAMDFFGALVATGYMMYIVGAVEVLVGLLLVAKKYVPLALVLFGPIALNILLFHLFLDLPSIPVALVVVVLYVFLLLAHKSSYDGLLKA